MAGLESYAIYIFIAIAGFTAIKLFSIPVRWIVKLLLNTAFGFLLLFLFNSIRTYTGISLGFNLVNASVIGIFGIPGFGLLLLLQWLFTI